jgi:hypothetical protein
VTTPNVDEGVRAMVAAIIHDTFCPDATEPEPMFLEYSGRAGDTILAYLAEQRILNPDADAMRNALENFADHGIRCDLNPTGNFRDVGTLYDQWTAMLRGADAYVRNLARRALLVALVPHPRGGEPEEPTGMLGRLWRLAEGRSRRRLIQHMSWWPFRGAWRALRPGEWEWAAALEWEIRDLWVGAYVKAELMEPCCANGAWMRCVDVYVCPLPTLVVHVWFRREEGKGQ